MVHIYNEILLSCGVILDMALPSFIMESWSEGLWPEGKCIYKKKKTNPNPDLKKLGVIFSSRVSPAMAGINKDD